MSDAPTKPTDEPKRPKDEYEGRARFGSGLLTRMLRFVVPHKGLLGAALLMFPLVAAVQLVQPWVLKETIDGPIKDGLVSEIGKYAALYLGLILLQALLQFTQNTIMQLAGQRVMRDIRTRLFDRVVTLATSYFDRTPLGKVLTRLTSDVSSLPAATSVPHRPAP